MTDYKAFQETVREIYTNSRKEGRLLDNPTIENLRKLSLQEPEVRRTRYGSFVVDSEATSRAAMFTENNIDSEFGRDEHELLEQAKKYLENEELISIDVPVGDGSEGITGRLVVPKKFAHVGYGGIMQFTQTSTKKEPTYQVIMFFDEAYESNKSKKLPHKDITIRIAHDRDGKMVKVIRNSNYFGEFKKGIFTGEDWRVKQDGNAIFLHAGCRQDYLKTAHGDYKTQNSLFVALSANGKTSLTCRVLACKEGEESWLIQDDGGTLRRDGSFRGFEAGGLFVKTDALNPDEQREIFYACLRPNTFLENVHVDEEGRIDFYNVERTSNGRAVIERRDLMHASQEINVSNIDNLFLITRYPTIPAIFKMLCHPGLKSGEFWNIAG
jgi:phosphoenolpyruvate carboxykinase (ATP)